MTSTRKCVAGNSVDDRDGFKGLTMMGEPFDCIIFDVDGTLSDSIDAYYEMFRQLCASFDLEVCRSDVLEPMITGDNIWDRAIPHHIPDRDHLIKEAMKEMPQVYKEVISLTNVFPDVKLLLERLKSCGIKLGLLTSSWKYALMPLEKEGLLPYFSVIITREKKYPAKPKPDGILACLAQMGAESSETIVIGDSPVDIKAGKAAGTRTIGVLSGIADRNMLTTEAPDMIVNCVGDLLRVFGINS